MKILERSLNIARQLHVNRLTQAHHIYSFIFDKNELVSIGQNNMLTPNKKAYDIGLKYNIQHFKDYSFLHSEMDSIGKLANKRKITGKEHLIVIRLDYKFQTKLAKPCKNCSEVIKAFGFKNIHYTDNNQWCSMSYKDIT